MIRRIIFGCHNLTGGSSYWRSKRLVDTAFALGIRRFDVAPSYGLGTAEATLARALGTRKRHPDLEITTKFGILPPRFGYYKALVREPYRHFTHQFRDDCTIRARPMTRPARIDARTPCPDYPFSANEAAQRSLRSLGIERLDGFLVHERLPRNRSERLAEEIFRLKENGLVVRAGVSGHLDNVRDMAAAMKAPDIVQVAAADAKFCLRAGELRAFNIMSILQEHSRRTPTDPQSGDVSAERVVAAELANAVGRFLAEQPQASVLFNTSSPHRLELFVAALSG